MSYEPILTRTYLCCLPCPSRRAVPASQPLPVWRVVWEGRGPSLYLPAPLAASPSAPPPLYLPASPLSPCGKELAHPHLCLVLLTYLPRPPLCTYPSLPPCVGRSTRILTCDLAAGHG